MEIVTQNTGELTSAITVKIAASDYEANVEKQLKRTRQTAEIKGFRKGMVPMSLIKRMYGQSVMMDEISKVLSESMNEYMQNETRDFIGEPIPVETSFDRDNQKDFDFEYKAGFYPEFNLELKDLEMPYYRIIPSETETDNEIEYYRKRFGKQDAAEVTENGDLVKAEVKINDEPAEATFLIDKIAESQRAALTGLKKGDETEVEIRAAFPNETDLINMLGIGKEVLDTLPEKMMFTIKEITRVYPADLNQEFFDKVCGEGKVQDEAEFRAYLEEQAKSYYEQLSLSRLYHDSDAVLDEKGGVELPADFIRELMIYLNRDKENFTEEDLDKQMPSITKELTRMHIINSTLKKYEVKITEEDIVNEAYRTVVRRFNNYGIYDLERFDLDSLIKHTLDNREEVDQIVSGLKADRFAVLLKDNATLLNKDVTIEEYNALYKAEEEAAPEA